MIILLNGTSSAGKSSIAHEIMRQSATPFILFSVDHLVNFWIDEKFTSMSTESPTDEQKAWFYYLEEKDAEGRPITSIHDGPKALKLHQDMIEAISVLAKKQYPLIIDEVFWNKENVKSYQKALAGLAPIYLTYVHCDIEIAEQREKQRIDRYLGLSRGILNQVKKISLPYDLNLNTTHQSAKSCATRLLEFIKANPNPKAFSQIIVD